MGLESLPQPLGGWLRWCSQRGVPSSAGQPSSTLLFASDHGFDCEMHQPTQLRSASSSPAIRCYFASQRDSASLGLAAAFTFTITPVSAGEEPAASPIHTVASFMDRETLTGDWFGAGPTLRDPGVSIAVSLTQFYGGLMAGDGSHDWEYGGRLFNLLIGARRNTPCSR